MITVVGQGSLVSEIANVSTTTEVLAWPRLSVYCVLHEIHCHAARLHKRGLGTMSW